MRKQLVHFECGLGDFGPSDIAGWHAGDRRVPWYFVKDDVPGTDLRADANSNVAEDFRPRADEDAIAHLWVTIPGFLSGAAKPYLVKRGDVVADNGGLADYDSRSVIEQDA